MVVSELVATLGIKTDAASVAKADNTLKKFMNIGKAFVGSWAVLKVGGFIKHAVDSTTELAATFEHMHARTGVATETLQELGYVAKLAGTSVESMETALKILSRTMMESQKSGSEIGKIYQKLGIQTKDAKGQLRPVADLLPELADKFKNMKSDTEKSAMAVKLFGRAGTMLLPVLKQGGDALRAQMAEAHDYGAVIDNELITASMRYHDNQIKTAYTYQMLRNAITKGLLPSLTRMQERWLEWVKKNKEWLNLKIETTFAKIGQLVEDLSTAIHRGTGAFSEWFSKLDSISKGLLTIGMIVAGVAVLLMLPGGSIILLIGLMAILIQDFERWREGSTSVIGDVINRFNKLTGIDLGDFGRRFKLAFIQPIETFAKRSANLVLMIEEMGTMGSMKAVSRANAREIDLQNESMRGSVNAGNALRGLSTPFSSDVTQKAQNRNNIAAGFDYLYGNLKEGQSIIPEGASAMPTSIPVHNIQNNNINVTVETSPGMDNDLIGQKVREQIKEEMDAQNRYALQSLSQ